MTFCRTPASVLLLSISPAIAGAPAAPLPPAAPAQNWLTGENLNFGGVLFPHVHFQSTYGRTSASRGHEFGAGHHDPVKDGWTVQGFELAVSGRWNEHLETYAAWHGSWQNEAPHAFDHEFEEYFLKFKDLPGGFDVRAGRFLNRFGLHNTTHVHGWDWADNFLVSGRFLGDDGQYSRGAEVTWHLPVKWTSALSFSAGHASAAHEHEEEEEAHGAALYEAEGAAIDGTLYTLNWTNLWEWNDFHLFRGGLSCAWGENTWGRRSTVLGAHVQYEWRQNGASPGGNYLRWRTEVMLRDVEAVATASPEVTGSFDEWGLYSSTAYGFDLPHGVLEAGLRAEWVEGVARADLPARTRVSPGLTWYVNDARNAWFRVQYNRDHIEDRGAGDSVWLGAGVNWGGHEVR